MTYVPSTRRAGIAALFALDDVLGGIVKATREPLLGQMRLTWWHGALTALDSLPPPAEPVLAELASTVLPRGVTGATLAEMIEGWEILLGAETLDDAALEIFAAARGGGLFGAAARLLDTGDPRIEAAGRGWALADLAHRHSDAAVRGRARSLAMAALRAIGGRRWDRRARPLAMLAALARRDVHDDRPRLQGSPRRVLRMLALGLTGF